MLGISTKIKIRTEEILTTSHPRIGQPQVCGLETTVDLLKYIKKDSDSDGIENGKVTSRNYNKDVIHSNNLQEMRNGNDGVEVMKLDDEELSRRTNKIKMVNNRHVSVTAAGDAVIVRGAQKSYKSGTPVLKGLNMTVPCGSIYGLLGSSGCGKTTLLSCIVGQRMLDSGEIYLFGKPVGDGTKSIGIPGRNIGYMPQDFSLYVEFSIRETLTYFGTLCGLNKEEIRNEIEFLVKLLDLPVETRRVGTLSGGQRRRVSFAAALIHSPELLILDEPTVGVDPIMRQNIWIHLQKLVCIKRTTVIITTHYIEECRQADNIGLMRNGRLLVERQPNDLFTEHGSTNLEKIVLNLSRKDDSPKLDPKELVQRLKKRNWFRKRVKEGNGEIKSGQDETDNPFTSKDSMEEYQMASVLHKPEPALTDSLVRIRALAGKNFVILFRNPLLLFFVVLISALMLLVVGYTLGPDPTRLPIGLVNYELDYNSMCPNVTRIPAECNFEHLSCHFLMNIPKDSLKLKLYNNETEAIRATQDGSTWGYIMFPNNFSEKLFERVASGSNVDDSTFNSSQIIVRLDDTSMFIDKSKRSFKQFDKLGGTLKGINRKNVE